MDNYHQSIVLQTTHVLQSLCRDSMSSINFSIWVMKLQDNHEAQVKLDLETVKLSHFTFLPKWFSSFTFIVKRESITSWSKAKDMTKFNKSCLFSLPSAFWAKVVPRDRKQLIACFDFLASAFPSGSWQNIV